MPNYQKKYANYSTNVTKKEISSFWIRDKIVFKDQAELDLFYKNLTAEYQHNLQEVQNYVKPKKIVVKSNTMLFKRSRSYRSEILVKHMINGQLNFQYNLDWRPKQIFNSYNQLDNVRTYKYIYRITGGLFHSTNQYFDDLWKGPYYQSEVLPATKDRVKKFVNFDKVKKGKN